MLSEVHETIRHPSETRRFWPLFFFIWIWQLKFQNLCCENTIKWQFHIDFYHFISTNWILLWELWLCNSFFLQNNSSASTLWIIDSTEYRMFHKSFFFVKIVENWKVMFRDKRCKTKSIGDIAILFTGGKTLARASL